jgi:hypothetical protein
MIVAQQGDAKELFLTPTARRSNEYKQSTFQSCQNGGKFFLVESSDGDAIDDWNHVISQGGIPNLELQKLRFAIFPARPKRV